MGELIIVGRREKYDTDKFYRIDVTSHNIIKEQRESLSPFYLGPVECYDDKQALLVENAWQYSKVYPNFVDSNENPTVAYFMWRDNGWNNPRPQRHPMGGTKPLYSLWKDETGNFIKLPYIEARKKIYIPLYAQAIFNNPHGLNHIKALLKYNNIALADFDGYNFSSLGMSLYDVLHDEGKIMGHVFVLATILTDCVRLEDGKIIVDEEAMKKCKNIYLT